MARSPSPVPEPAATVEVPGESRRGPTPSIGSILSVFRYGHGDPTTRLSPGSFVRATRTPDGPGTVHIRWRAGAVDAEAWGPGAEWLMARAEAMTGAGDPGHRFPTAHPAILRAQRDHDIRFGASGDLYHELLPTVLAQRITGGEAIAQWRRLTRALGAPAPGPIGDLLLPPDPLLLARRPTWWFHPMGIEGRRADTLRAVGRHADRLTEWQELPPAEQAARLALLPGVGEWTIGSVLGVSAGDPDAVAVGDFHLKNVVVHTLTGRPRGTDAEMLELLAPYAGQRGRVVRLLLAGGASAPKFGPRQKVLPLHRW